MSVAPQAVLSPCRAMGAPSHEYLDDPDTIGFNPWIGQENMSPTRAASAPSKKCFAQDPTTAPPWDDVSPFLTTRGILGVALFFERVDMWSQQNDEHGG